MTNTTQPAALPRKYWARLCALPKFSFLLNATGGVERMNDGCGNWVEISEVQQIVDDAENHIAELEAQAAAKCLHQIAEPASVDALARILFDAWTKSEPGHSVTQNPTSYLSTFADMARAALQAAPPAQAVVAVPDGKYPPLPEPTAFLFCKGSEVTARAWNADQMRAYVDAARVALAAAPAQAAPESHTQALEAIATWPVTDMLMNMDAANMRGIAQRALAAPAQEASMIVTVKEGSLKFNWAGGAMQSGEHTPDDAAPAQEHATQLAGQAQDWDKTRNSLTMLLMGWVSKPNKSIESAKVVLDAVTEPGMPLAYLRAAAPAQAQEDAPIVWPKSRDVGRIGDMSMSASLRVGLDGDNDTYVSVWDESGSGSIEFCTPGAGGGKSGRTRAALLALMVAMEADNAEDPRRDWWAVRAAQGGRDEQ